MNCATASWPKRREPLMIISCSPPFGTRPDASTLTSIPFPDRLAHTGRRGCDGRQDSGVPRLLALLSPGTCPCGHAGAALCRPQPGDRKSVGSGKSVSVRVYLVGRRILK